MAVTKQLIVAPGQVFLFFGHLGIGQMRHSFGISIYRLGCAELADKYILSVLNFGVGPHIGLIMDRRHVFRL